MARQYFNASLADPLIAAITITPLTANTALFTAAQAGRYFPLPSGAEAPAAGQIFRFALGGVLTTPATGTLTITPYMGTAITGTSMGASVAQTHTVSGTAIPWRMEGDVVFRTISELSTTSTASCSGNFISQAATTVSSAFVIAFGSTATVDTSGAANLSGAINFGFQFSVTGATVTTNYTSFQSLN